MFSGSVPTENLPKKKYDIVRPERRVLVRLETGVGDGFPSNLPSSSSSVIKTPSLESAVERVQDNSSWALLQPSEDIVKLELYDNLHSLPKYIVHIYSSQEFTIAVHNWPIKENHPIYNELNCSVEYHSVDDLLNTIEQSSLCKGLPKNDFDVMSVVVEPTSKVTTPGTVLRHSIPKVLTSEQTHIETTLAFQSVDCKVSFNSLIV